METTTTITLFLYSLLLARSSMQCPRLNNDKKNSTRHGADEKVTLNIIGLFSMSGDYPAGLAYLPAALLAVNHINDNKDVLPGYRLKINPYNTMCDESQGLDAFYKEVYNPNRTSIMTLGGTCSHVTEATAQVSAIWGLTQISYSAMSPHLSNRQIFPNFFRVMTPEQNLTVGRIQLFKQFSWKKAHIIYQNFKLFSTLDEYMKQDLERNNIQVVSNEMFTTLKPRDTVLALKRNNARIIIANMYEDKARQVMCAVYNLEGSRSWYRKVVWFIPFFYDRNWMYIQDPMDNCTTDQILDVLGNYFSVGSPAYLKDKGYRTVFGDVPAAFYKKYMDDKLYSRVADEIPDNFKEFYTKSPRGTGGLFCKQRAPEAYDAVWAIAIALNNTLNALKATNSTKCLEDFQYTDQQFSQLLRDGMTNVSFNATSGPFFFDSNGERTTGIEIWQYHNNYRGSDLTVIGTCQVQKSKDWNCTVYEDKVKWNNGQVPVDGVQTQNRILNIDLRIVYTLSALACLGILLTAGLLIFNILHRDHRIIKMSSPRLNNVILVGCILGYSTILMLDVQGKETGVVCVLRSFTIVLSFSFTFGALFAKTWRVYEIFTAGARVLNSRMLRDSSLFLIITILILVNCLTLVGWVVASPQRPTLITISVTQASDNSDMNFTNVYQRCDSAYRLHFTWALVAIQGVVILLGTYLAIQTRKVTFPELNDSKWIALCIYNVVVLGPVGVIVVMATEDKPEINYALEAGMLMLVTTMTQGLIFVPKIIAYRKHNRNHSSSLDITFKLRNMNEIVGIFTLDPSMLSKNEETSTKSTSGSCQASQQTDFSDLACPFQCQCSLKDAAMAPEEFAQPRRRTNFEDNVSLLFRSMNNRAICLPASCGSKSGSKFQKLEESTSRGGSMKHLRRSWSEASLGVDSNANSQTSWIEQRHEDIRRIERPNSSTETEDRPAIVWRNITLQENRSNVASRCEDSPAVFLDAIKVKTDLKVSSRLKANWTESRGHLNNTEHICELLNRLKKAVEAGEEGAKV